MSHEVLLTQEGYEKIKKELEFLKGSERQRIADNIREAKSHGDLKENAMYHEAKLNQTRLESRISDLESTLQFAKIVEKPEGHTGAHLGSLLKLKDLTWGGEMNVTLVGEFEADPINDKVSITSPLGSALMDKQPGDKVQVEAPAGVQEYEVISVD